MHIVHPYACFSRQIICDTSTSIHRHIVYSYKPVLKSKRSAVLYICADYPYYSCLFVFSTAIPTSLSSQSNYFLYLSVFILYDLRSFHYFDNFNDHN